MHFGESNHDSGYLKLMIKIYPQGKMTQHLATTKVGMCNALYIFLNMWQSCIYLEVHTYSAPLQPPSLLLALLYICTDTMSIPFIRFVVRCNNKLRQHWDVSIECGLWTQDWTMDWTVSGLWAGLVLTKIKPYLDWTMSWFPAALSVLHWLYTYCEEEWSLCILKW